MSALPSVVSDGTARVLGRLTGRVPRVVETRRIGGGCINASAHVRLDAGDDVFVKWNDACPSDFFTIEAAGLRALAEATSLRVPEVLGTSDPDAPGPAWLVLEYVPEGRAARRYEEVLGEGLAELHRGFAKREDGSQVSLFGWEQDNYIGTLPQINATTPRWPDFWRDARLLPQLERARTWIGVEDRAGFGRLFSDLDRTLDVADADGSSLLHGDLWSGNVYSGADGLPVLVDPAVYRGHREVDLAMSELFGGFSRTFHEAYDEAWPLQTGYRSRRRAIYQLYPLLVHVNLFGAGYLHRLRRALAEALAQ